ncbi:MAG: phosphocholine cytidylyltransferase family protein [Prevotellaceae bacterium]|nr:phosphocholine cytidylyltransferase family protein [Candidatus Colivivens caballi]
MIGVILAAGMASRLRPLTNDRPKCLLTVGNRPLLQRTMDALCQQQACIDEFVVVTGYLHEQIEQFLTSHYPDKTIHFIYNADYQTTNNIYSLWLARPFIDGKDFILLDSDILFDPSIALRILSQTDTVLALNRHELGDEEIKVIVDQDNRVMEISKTCSISDAIGESVGIEKMNAEYSKALFTELRQMIDNEGLVNVFYEMAFERLIKQGHQFRIIDTTDLFSIELDTVEDFNQAKQLIPQHLY